MLIFTKFYVGIILMIYFSFFMGKNLITRKRLKKDIKGKSIKVNLTIITTTMLYLLAYVSIFFNTGILFNINVLNHNILKVAGLILVTIAFVLGVTTLMTMKNSWRVGVRPEQETELILIGIFLYSRNPYFLSYILIFLGIFLIFPNIVFLFFYVLMIILVHLMILDEERHLTNQHGEVYLNYKKSVGRYLIF